MNTLIKAELVKAIMEWRRKYAPSDFNPCANISSDIDCQMADAAAAVYDCAIQTSVEFAEAIEAQK